MSFTKTAHLPVSPDEAFALITQPDRLRRWQTITAFVDLRAGGNYQWAVVPGQVAAGTFKEIEPGRRIVLGWGWEGNSDLPPGASTVTITIEPADGGSAVTLTHEGLTPEQAEQHALGWNHYFERLEKYVTTGSIGPDEWARVPDSLDPFTATESVLSAVQPMLTNLTPADQPKPTPCADFTCHDVANHLLQSLALLGGMAGATVSVPQDGSLESRVSTVTGAVVHGWRQRGLEGTVEGPGGYEMPGPYAAGIVPIELLLHSWDLAEGSGQELDVSDEVVAYVRGLAEDIIPGGREGGSFAAEVTPAPDSDALERLAAFAGRSPLSS